MSNAGGVQSATGRRGEGGGGGECVWWQNTWTRTFLPSPPNKSPYSSRPNFFFKPPCRLLLRKRSSWGASWQHRDVSGLLWPAYIIFLVYKELKKMKLKDIFAKLCNWKCLLFSDNGPGTHSQSLVTGPRAWQRHILGTNATLQPWLFGPFCQ